MRRVSYMSSLSALFIVHTVNPESKLISVINLSLFIYQLQYQ